jgi:hypothetical protein
MLRSGAVLLAGVVVVGCTRDLCVRLADGARGACTHVGWASTATRVTSFARQNLQAVPEVQVEVRRLGGEAAAADSDGKGAAQRPASPSQHAPGHVAQQDRGSRLVWLLLVAGFLCPPCWWAGIIHGWRRSRRGALSPAQRTAWLACCALTCISSAAIILGFALAFGRPRAPAGPGGWARPAPCASAGVLRWQRCQVPTHNHGRVVLVLHPTMPACQRCHTSGSQAQRVRWQACAQQTSRQSWQLRSTLP